MDQSTGPRASERGVVVDRGVDALFLSYGGRYGVSEITARSRVEAEEALARWFQEPVHAREVAACIASALFDTADEVERALRVITEQGDTGSAALRDGGAE